MSLYQQRRADELKVGDYILWVYGTNGYARIDAIHADKWPGAIHFDLGDCKPGEGHATFTSTDMVNVGSVLPSDDTPPPAGRRSKLLDDYVEWTRERIRLSSLEERGGPPPGEWHYSDDQAVELLEVAMDIIADQMAFDLEGRIERMRDEITDDIYEPEEDDEADRTE